MRVDKPTYTVGGKLRRSPNYHVHFRDHLDTRRRVVAFTDKQASDELGRKIGKLVALVGAGERPDPQLARWIEKMPPHVRDKLAEWGILNERASAATKPLAVHLDDFRESLAARGNTIRHVDLVKSRARRVIDACRFTFWADIAPSKVETYLKHRRDGNGDKPGISAQTSNFHLQAVKQFCRWMVADRRAIESPIAHLKALNTRTDRRHDRRALTVDELGRLLRAAAGGPLRFGMTGPDRALLYRLAVETGLRRGEIASLTRFSFDLDGSEPTVTVAAAYSKHRREDVLPLRMELAEALRAHLAKKLPDAPAFKLPDRQHNAKMIRADLEAAGIPYRDDAGRVPDFHALRHTFITNLVRAGVKPKVAQSLARHGTIGLTMDRYSHSFVEDERTALESLPTIDGGADEQRATGTDDARACAPLVRKGAEHGRACPSMSASRYDKRRRGGRVAEGAGLENRFALRGNVGSNPTLSASGRIEPADATAGIRPMTPRDRLSFLGSLLWGRRGMTTVSGAAPGRRDRVADQLHTDRRQAAQL